MQDVIKDLKKARDKTELLLLKQSLEQKARELELLEKDLESQKSALNEDELEASKYIEFNSQSYGSFYNTKLEKDKSILTLSVAGLGFLITFTNFASALNIVEYGVFLVAAISYLFCVFHVITIFEKNALYIIAVTTNSNGSEDLEVQLEQHDKKAIYAFYIGILLSFILGISTSITKKIESDNMTDKNNINNSVPLEESFNGLGRINKSFAGIASMAPKPSSQEQPKTTQNTTKQKGVNNA